jgi:hypothetical protein
VPLAVFHACSSCVSRVAAVLRFCFVQCFKALQVEPVLLLSRRIKKNSSFSSPNCTRAVVFRTRPSGVR